MEIYDNKIDKIDKTDIEIMSILLKDAKSTYTEIGEQLNVSVGTIHVRIKKLEALNIIKGFTLDVDMSRLGLDLVAFIGFTIDGKSYKKIVERLKSIKEIVELSHTTGNYHMFAKVICKDTKQLKNLLLNKINAIDGIEKTETSISLEEILYSSDTYSKLLE
jgi:Lrp/AsnC family transcriptional regulator for asnA, asnC and gidA